MEFLFDLFFLLSSFCSCSQLFLKISKIVLALNSKFTLEQNGELISYMLNNSISIVKTLNSLEQLFNKIHNQVYRNALILKIIFLFSIFPFIFVAKTNCIENKE